ncbi:MAG: F0F1 ATP synthase subunit delta [Betaproteobacteria bacterium]|jgi:F-type H+-transporting ATPase subunit delta|nr:F0F1 ATP synthase subunit delta [Betaproteobacteria bacterium]
MAEPVTIARPYAEAAFRLAREQNALPAWSDALALIETVVAEPQVAAVIAAPQVSAAQVEALIIGAIGKHLSGEARNFVQVLAQNRRLGVAGQIRGSFESLRREHEGTMEATVVSALPVEDAQLKSLVSALEQKYGRRITAKVELDPKLIGGLKILVGDKVIDATVRGKLDAMAAALTH